MENKNVIIIGAGIAGLTLGCHLQRSGFDTEIFEAHTGPGGLCTGWERNGFEIDGCIETLLGSSPTNPYYQLFDEIVDMKQVRFTYPEIRRLYVFPNGQQFAEYNNLNHLLAAMLETAPEDAAVIREFIEDTRKLQKYSLTYDSPGDFTWMKDTFELLNVRTASLIMKWRDIGPYHFAGRFKNPVLKRVVACFASPVLTEMFKLAAADNYQAGYPIMGSRAFAAMFEKEYLALGGRIRYSARVNKVLVEKGTAKGVETADKERVAADIVVSAADGRSTIFDLLGGRFIRKDLRNLYEEPDLSPSILQISIGIGRKLEDCATKRILLDGVAELPDGSVHGSVDLMCTPMEDGERSLLTIRLNTDNPTHWWMQRKSSLEKYMMDKEKVAEWAIGLIEKRVFPIREDLKMVDVATPASYMRYTGNWKGATRGWVEKNIFGSNILPVRSELPGLKNFYMAGQWARPGGSVPGVLKNARDVAQQICRKERKTFASKLPERE